MRILLWISFFVTGIISNSFSQNLHWTEALKRGEVRLASDEVRVPVQMAEGYIIIPVRLKNRLHYFLFDSAAPSSISFDLFESTAYPIIATSLLYDSEGNEGEIEYVSIDSMYIGRALFLEETVFVGDFAVMDALDDIRIDGIIGSNLIKDVVWRIDWELKELVMTNDCTDCSMKRSVRYQSDEQFNIFVDVEIEKSILKNMKIDYGFNGSLMIDEELFNALNRKGKLKNVSEERGVSQSTFLGEPILTNFSVSTGNTVYLKKVGIDEVEVQSGSDNLFGTEILKRFNVTLDGPNERIYFE